MWVRTEERDLVNMAHVEFVRLEQEDGHHEVRAYPFQWIGSDDEVYYTLAASPDEGHARTELERLVGALIADSRFLDFAGP